MEAKNDGKWEAARTFLEAAHEIVPREDYITQQLGVARSMRDVSASENPLLRGNGDLGRDFRHPRLCTCASMRRLYPGHRSYSLASLCRTFDIPLKQHHRALCDAEAAAELLLLVNEKRAAA